MQPQTVPQYMNQPIKPPAAGDAQEVRPTSAVNPIGLYRNPETGVEVGVIEEIQGDAVIRQGFVLIEEGRDAAMKTQEEMDKTRERFLAKKSELDALVAELNSDVRTHQISPDAPSTVKSEEATVTKKGTK